MKETSLARAVRGAVNSGLFLSVTWAAVAHAQEAPALPTSVVDAVPTGLATPADSSTRQLQKFEVTGSLIKSSDKTRYNQVQTITAQDIQDSGATTVAEFLRGTTINSASSWGDDFAYGATGGSGIALHGLSEKYTLVLVDGQRVAPYAFPSNGTDSFVDLNTIPANIVDRIEIVKTGAVSQYGSDAIGGVVNIITKKNFQGLQLDGDLGDATSGGEFTKKFGVLGGFGNLASDHFNVTAAASYFEQNGYSFADRSNTKSEDYSNHPFGGLITGADYWGPNGAGNISPLSPCPSGGTVTNAGNFFNSPAGPGQACSVNTANGYSLHPYEQRFSGKVDATFRLDDKTQAFADFWVSRNITDTKQGYNGISDGTNAIDTATNTVTTLSNIVPQSNPYNTTGGPAPLTYTFLGQPQDLYTTSTFWRAATGVKGSASTASLGDWDWSASVSHSQSIVDNRLSGLLSVSGLSNVLNGGFNFSNPASTPNGLNGLYTTDYDEGVSTLDSLDLSASTANLFHLPAGNVGFGVGAQFLHESDHVSEFAQEAAGTAVPFSGLESVNGSRNVAAAYYQIDIPIVHGVSFSQSGRFDHYSDFGDAFSPRFALRFQPVDQVTTYASYSRGFRAPTFAENSQATGSGVQSVVDGGTYEGVPVLTRGNPNLQAERTKNYNLGFVLAPDAHTSLGFDWYKTVISNAIGTPNVQSLVDANDPSVVVRDQNGNIQYVNMGYENLNQVSTDGFEVNLHKDLPTSAGTFALFSDWAYIWHFKQTGGGQSVDFAGNDLAMDTPWGASMPRWKGNTSLTWSYRKFRTALNWQFTGPYQIAQIPNGGRAGSYSQFNLSVVYTGIKHWTLHAEVNNIFNRQPPFDPIWGAFPMPAPYDASLYSDEGRYIGVGASYRF